MTKQTIVPATDALPAEQAERFLTWLREDVSQTVLDGLTTRASWEPMSTAWGGYRVAGDQLE